MHYDLVFEGGGAKGLVFVGAVQAFDEAGHTFRRLLGTSAGAITATLLAAGYTAAEILPAINEKLPNGKPRFSSFMDIPAKFDEQSIGDSLSYSLLAAADIPFVPDRFEKPIDRLLLQALMELPVYRHIFSFVEKGGWYAGDEFLKWLIAKLDADGRDLADKTLAEFQSLQTETELSVVASDTSGNEMLVLNHRTAPDCPVVWAVRMSMSVPFLWQEVVWQKEWGTYRGRDISGHAIVDGGVLSNFPIWLLISTDREVVEIMGTTDAKSALGFLIDEALPVEGADPPEKAEDKPPLASHLDVDVKKSLTVQRIKRLVDTMTGARDKFVIDAYKDQVCRLPAKGYGTTEFDMSTQRMEALIQAGRVTTEKYLQTYVAPLTDGSSG